MILITGATGLVGSHLLHLLLKNNEKVKAIYRTEKSREKTKRIFNNYGGQKLFDKILWVKADLTDYFSLKDTFDGITHIYHCGAIVSFDRRGADKMHETNINGTKHLVDLSLEYGVKKFCFVSSVAALGKYSDDSCSDEDALWSYSKNTSDYAVSKFYAENEVWRGSEEGLNVVIVNPATILGFGDWNESSSAIFKKVNNGLNYYPPGSNGFVGVHDVIKAMHLIMNSEISGQRYILVSENWSFKKLLSTIAIRLEKKPPQNEAPRLIANLLRRIDELRYFIFGSKSVLTKQSVETAFNTQCYSAKKAKTELGIEFEPLDAVINEAAELFKKDQIIEFKN